MRSCRAHCIERTRLGRLRCRRTLTALVDARWRSVQHRPHPPQPRVDRRRAVEATTPWSRARRAGLAHRSRSRVGCDSRSPVATAGRDASGLLDGIVDAVLDSSPDCRTATTRPPASSNAEPAFDRSIIALSVTDVPSHSVGNGRSCVKWLRLSSAQATRRLDSSRVPSPTQVVA